MFSFLSRAGEKLSSSPKKKEQIIIAIPKTHRRIFNINIKIIIKQFYQKNNKANEKSIII